MAPDGISEATFRRLLARSVAAPPALLTVLALTFLGEIFYLVRASGWVDHTDRVISRAHTLSKLLVDGETGMRGYLITGDRSFLEPYLAEEGGIDPAFEGLIAMVSDNPPQVERLKALRADHADWQAYARAMIDLRALGGDYATPVRNRDGKRRMDAMRAQAAAFIGIEEALRDARTRAVRWATEAVVGTSLGLTISLGAALAYLTRRHLATATASFREALAEASRLAAIVESSQDAIIGKTLDGLITSWSPGAAALYGYSAEEVIGRPIALLIPPGMPDELPAILERVRRGERVETFETRRIAKDGRLIDVSLTISPVKDRAGTVFGAAAIARDITAAKQATGILERLARRLEALHEIDRAILGAESLERLVAAALDRLVRVMPCDRTAVALLDDELGQATVVAAEKGHEARPVETLPVADLPAVASLREGSTWVLREAISPARCGPGWERILGEGGGGLAAFPLRDDRRLRGILYLSACDPGSFGDEHRAIGHEVADQFAVALQQAELRRQLQQHAAELERRVEERTAQLQETNAALEAFSYTISHDLRAPLRAMQGIAQALLEDYGDRLEAGGRDYAGRVIESAYKMDALIEDLLAYSRLSGADLRPHIVDLGAAVGQALDQLRTEVSHRGADVSVSEPLPPVAAHWQTLVQVIANLVENAMKFVAPGVQPRVRIRAERLERRVRLWVEDNGLGVDPLQQDRIFKVFERLHGDDAYPGTGIGLAIVRKGAERMGGRAGVESAGGRGSRFWIELPRG